MGLFILTIRSSLEQKGKKGNRKVEWKLAYIFKSLRKYNLDQLSSA